MRRGSAAAVLALGLAVFVWAHVARLDALDFRNDEFLTVAAAWAHARTGEYTVWDFHRDEPGREYRWGKPFHWQLSQIYQRSDISERGTRLLSVFWSVLRGIVPSTRKIQRNHPCFGS